MRAPRRAAAPAQRQPEHDGAESDSSGGPAVQLPAAEAYQALLGGLQQATRPLEAPHAKQHRRNRALGKACQPVVKPLQTDSAQAQADAGHAEDAEGAEAAQQPEQDYYSSHFGTVLTDADVAELRSGNESLARPSDDLQQPAGCHWHWETTRGHPLPQAPARLAAYGVRDRLVARWADVQREDSGEPLAAPEQRNRKRKAPLDAEAAGDGQAQEAEQQQRPAADCAAVRFGDALQRSMFSLCNSYRDVLLTERPYPTRDAAPDPVMDACLLHCINHCTKAAASIKRNNERLQAAEHAASIDGVRDQGFTRCKVLILLPMRNIALRWVSRLLQLVQRETRGDAVLHKQRFLQEFAGDEGKEEEEPCGKQRAWQPEEHRALFSGSADDQFRLGIKITRGAVRLYVDFYSADIIVASPLALAAALHDAEAEGPGAADFLSSVEVLLVERCDVLQMQNWAHVVTAFEAVNQLPKVQRGADIMRVREASLSGQAALHRQTILLSSFASPELNALFARRCSSHARKARSRALCQGILGSVRAPIRQLFEKLDCTSAADAADDRYAYFCKHLWPRIKEAGTSGQLIFVSSYLDYVRLRNLLLEERASFVGLSEYAPHPEVSRGRSHFFHGRRRVMLYTERAHFYHRYRIRGVKDIMFYQLPEHKQFYAELVNQLEEASHMQHSKVHATVSTIFTKLDALRLERIVGQARCKKMLKSESHSFVYC